MKTHFVRQNLMASVGRAPDREIDFDSAELFESETEAKIRAKRLQEYVNDLRLHDIYEIKIKELNVKSKPSPKGEM
jgi:hypothetical protein